MMNDTGNSQERDIALVNEKRSCRVVVWWDGSFTGPIETA